MLRLQACVTVSCLAILFPKHNYVSKINYQYHIVSVIYVFCFESKYFSFLHDALSQEEEGLIEPIT